MYGNTKLTIMPILPIFWECMGLSDSLLVTKLPLAAILIFSNIGGNCTYSTSLHYLKEILLDLRKTLNASCQSPNLKEEPVRFELKPPNPNCANLP